MGANLYYLYTSCVQSIMYTPVDTADNAQKWEGFLLLDWAVCMGFWTLPGTKCTEQPIHCILIIKCVKTIWHHKVWQLCWAANIQQWKSLFWHENLHGTDHCWIPWPVTSNMAHTYFVITWMDEGGKSVIWYEHWNFTDLWYIIICPQQPSESQIDIQLPEVTA